MIFLYILLGIITIIFLLSFYIAKTIFKPKIFQYEETKKIEIDKEYFSEEIFNKYDIQDVYIEDQVRLHAQYINQNSSKTVIIMHGYTYTLYGSYKYAHTYLELGYNVLLPDQRYHGLSEGKNTTLGYLEQKDLNNWIEYILKHNTQNQVLGVHGESMGAATVLLSGNNKNISFVISDCSFASLKLQVQDILTKIHIPKWIIYPTNLISKLLFDVSILKTSPIQNIRNITAPILLIHGSKDTYIRLHHFDLLKQHLKQNDSFYICENADHAMSYPTNPIRYSTEINQFLEQNNM